MTGSVTTDGIINSQTSEFFSSQAALVTTGSTAKVYATNTTFDGTNGSLVLQSRPTAGADVYIAAGATPKVVAKFHDGGDVSLYEDTGTSPKLFWDASAKSLGIGTSTPDSGAGLEVFGKRLYVDAADDYALRLEKSSVVGGYIGAPALSNLAFYSSGGTERMRIDGASGSVGIGTSSPAALVDLKDTTPTLRLTDDRNISWTGNETLGNIEFFSSDTSGDGTHVTGFIKNIQDRTGGSTQVTGALSFGVADYGVAAVEAFRIDSLGNLGLGTASPITAANYANLTLNGSSGGQIHFADDDVKKATIQSAADDLYVQSGSQTIFRNGGFTSGDEAMRIDASGHLLVGATSESTWESAAGFRARNSGSTTITRDGNPPLYVNRLNSDGTLLQLQNGTSVVGSIGTVNGDMYLGTGDTGLFFSDGSNYIMPYNVSTPGLADGLLDLGRGTNRFKALYLSSGVIAGPTTASNVGSASNFSVSNGDIQLTLERTTQAAGWGGIGANSSNALHVYNESTQKVLQVNQTDGSIQFPQSTSAGIYLGGTAAANKISDFETGTFTPVMENVTGWSGSSGVSGNYTKIGNTVHVFISMTSNVALTGTPTNKITGLPFSSDLNERCSNVSISRMFGIGLTTTDYIAGVTLSEINFSYVNGDNNVNNLTHSGSTLRITLSATYTTAA